MSVRPSFAYDYLLLPKLAVYASPENLENMKNNLYKVNDGDKPSSVNALQVFTVKHIKIIGFFFFVIIC